MPESPENEALWQVARSAAAVSYAVREGCNSEGEYLKKLNAQLEADLKNLKKTTNEEIV